MLDAVAFHRVDQMQHDAISARAHGMAERDRAAVDIEPCPIELAGSVWGGRYRGQRQKWFVMRFTGRDSDINLATEHPEFDAWRWIAPFRLPELIVPFKRRLYIDILAEFQEHCLDCR